MESILFTDAISEFKRTIDFANAAMKEVITNEVFYNQVFKLQEKLKEINTALIKEYKTKLLDTSLTQHEKIVWHYKLWQEWLNNYCNPINDLERELYDLIEYPKWCAFIDDYGVADFERYKQTTDDIDWWNYSHDPYCLVSKEYYLEAIWLICDWIDSFATEFAIEGMSPTGYKEYCMLQMKEDENLEVNLPKTIGKKRINPQLTHQLQMLLLERLGALKSITSRDWTTERKAIVIANLLNRSDQDTRAMLTYMDGKPDKRYFFKSKENIENLDKFFLSNGLTDI